MMKRKKRSTDTKIFEKKSINDPDKINTTVESIPVYGPNQGLAPKDYQLSPMFNDLETNIRTYCMEFLEKSNPDEYNSSYEDAIIDRICLEAINFIRVQRADHIQVITKPLNDMHNGDYLKCKRKLESFKRLREEIAKEKDLFKRIYRAGTSLVEE